ncbi:MAG: amidohydrolase family protein [Usitatibacter sp.]
MKAPKLVAPPGAVDTHMHIYDTGIPSAPGGPALPGHFPVDAYREVQRRLGLSRTVIVQPNAYVDDNRCTLAAIAELGSGARGVAVVKPGVTDAELERLTRGGFRAIRFMALPGGALGWDVMDELAARVQPFGWHSIVQLDGRRLPEHEAQIRRLPGKFIIDHVGKFLEPVTPDHESFRSLLRLVDTGRCWVKLSAPYEVSRTGAPLYEDVGALAKALVRAAPERMLWASNWPHPSVPPERRPDDADLLDLLLEWAPDDATRKKILVDNPAALYDF